LVLGLDALRSPAYARSEPIAAFQAAHGEWASSLGYQAIWIVGPGVDLTFELTSHLAGSKASRLDRGHPEGAQADTQ
jgi:hypothetical protein